MNKNQRYVVEYAAAGQLFNVNGHYVRRGPAGNWIDVASRTVKSLTHMGVLRVDMDTLVVEGSNVITSVVVA